MNPQVYILCGTIRALWALVWPLAGVCPHVTLQMALLSSRVWAEWTLVRLRLVVPVIGKT